MRTVDIYRRGMRTANIYLYNRQMPSYAMYVKTWARLFTVRIPYPSGGLGNNICWYGKGLCAKHWENTAQTHGQVRLRGNCTDTARSLTTPSPSPALWSRHYSTRVLVCHTTLMANSMETELLERHCKFHSTSNSMHTVWLPPLKVKSVFRGPSWLWISSSIWQTHTWWTEISWSASPLEPMRGILAPKTKSLDIWLRSQFLRRVIWSQIIAAGLRNPRCWDVHIFSSRRLRVDLFLHRNVSNLASCVCHYAAGPCQKRKSADPVEVLPTKQASVYQVCIH